ADDEWGRLPRRGAQASPQRHPGPDQRQAGYGSARRGGERGAHPQVHREGLGRQAAALRSARRLPPPPQERLNRLKRAIIRAMRRLGFLFAVALAVAADSAAAQATFPARPVRMVVGFAPGGGTDIIARLVAQKLGERWGQAVVVDNRPGASGNIGAELVARSAPGGYTLLMAFSSHASNPALGKLPFDIERDFTSITQVGSAPMVVVANPAAPAKTLGELIAYARSHPGAIKFGSSGIGTPVHLAGELMMQLTGTSMVHVPYKGIAPPMPAILARHIHITHP